jgi:hypothetical protein
MVKVTRAEVKLLFKWLNVPLHGELIKSREEFLKPVYEAFGDIEPKRLEILNEYSEKDKKGKTIFEEGKFKLMEDKKEECLQKFNAYLDEEVEIGATPKVLADIRTILTQKMTTPLDIPEGKAHTELVEKLK